MIPAGIRGFTLLEVMIALAIMGVVVITLLGAVNYQVGIVADERSSTAMTLLARTRMAEIEQSPAKGEGSFAPSHPDLKWKAELVPASFPGLRKLVVRVQRTGDNREVELVRIIPQ